MVSNVITIGNIYRNNMVILGSPQDPLEKLKDKNDLGKISLLIFYLLIN